jgi:hypothetical protein
MARPKSTDPRTKILHVRQSASEAALLDACAAHHGGTASDLFRTLLTAYAEHYGVVVQGAADLPVRGNDPISIDPDKRDESAGGYYAPNEPAAEHDLTVSIFDFARIREDVREFYDGVLDASEFDELFVVALDDVNAKVVTRSSGSLTMNFPLSDLERVA